MNAAGTVLTDLSANVFAALLLILLILLQAGADAPDGAPGPPTEAAKLGAVGRAPLHADALVAILHARRPDAEGLSIDLTEVEPPPLDAALRGLDPALPVRIYVFSHRHYPAVAARLAGAGRPWDEISVPPALGDAEAGWTPAFRALLARRSDLPRFRAELARLLGGAAGPPAPGAGGAPDPRPAGAMGERLRGWLGAAVTVAMLLGAIAAVVAIEWIVPRPRPRYAERSGAETNRGDGP